jgi:hypothetical protein
MKRSHFITVLAGLALGACAWWMAQNTYWGETKVPMPLRGEALTNPFYASQRFVEGLGARTTFDRTLKLPDTDAVIVLSAWHWTLTKGRREALERWVESGGRLVIDRQLTGGEEEFGRWSGVVREEYEVEEPEDFEDLGVGILDVQPCDQYQEAIDATLSSSIYRLCDVDTDSYLTSETLPDWLLDGDSGVQAVRVAVGSGSVAVINATPFTYRSLFEGDHARLLVAATALRRNDSVYFLSEEAQPSLLALLWRHGGPVVVLASAMVGLVLWRGSVRFGPLEAARESARRSLAEQIRGTGQFALRHDGEESLHAAVVRALDEVARRRIPGYENLSAKERASAISRLTNHDRNSIATAVHNPRSSRFQELPATISLLEATRRTLVERTRAHHGRR